MIWIQISWRQLLLVVYKCQILESFNRKNADNSERSNIEHCSKLCEHRRPAPGLIRITSIDKIIFNTASIIHFHLMIVQLWIFCSCWMCSLSCYCKRCYFTGVSTYFLRWFTFNIFVSFTLWRCEFSFVDNAGCQCIKRTTMRRKKNPESTNGAIKKIIGLGRIKCKITLWMCLHEKKMERNEWKVK